jgi:hypothetical protein
MIQIHQIMMITSLFMVARLLEKLEYHIPENVAFSAFMRMLRMFGVYCILQMKSRNRVTITAEN